MTKENLVIRFSVEEPVPWENPSYTAIVQEVCVSVAVEAMLSGKWRARAANGDAPKLWMGLGRSRDEAIAEFLKARICEEAFSWRSANAVLNHTWEIQDFANSFFLTLTEADEIIEELRARRKSERQEG